MSHLWISPPLDGPVSGGTLWNQRLLSELAQRGVPFQHCTLHEARSVDRGHHRIWWVDSLYLQAVPELRLDRAGRPLWLVLHYLPSLLEDCAPFAVVEREATALRLADGVLTTSVYMGDLAGKRGARRVYTVEPAVEPGSLTRMSLGDPVQIAVIANVTRNKGVLPLLEALAARVGCRDQFILTVVGDLAREPAYARQCQDLCLESPALRERVRLLGGRPPAETRVFLAASDLCVSASVFEAYGMVLAEASAAGVPILARAGGNVENHVDVDRGGQLCDSHGALADGLLALVRNPGELASRKRRALAHRRDRSWQTAIDDFLRLLSGIERG